MELSPALVVFIVYLMNQVDTWIIVIGNLLHLYFVFIGMLGFGLAVSAFYAGLENIPLKDLPVSKLTAKYAKTMLVVLIVLFGAKACSPNKETVQQMAIAYGATEVLNSDAAKEVGKQMTTLAKKSSILIEKKIDKAIKEN